MGNLKISKLILNNLEAARSAAARERCGVDDASQEAMRLYMDTWILGPLDDAIASIKGELPTWEQHNWKYGIGA
jgi:hypothetical protein